MPATAEEVRGGVAEGSSMTGKGAISVWAGNQATKVRVTKGIKHSENDLETPMQCATHSM